MEKLLIIIDYIKKVIEEEGFQAKYKTRPQDFTARESKIKFRDVIMFVLGRTNALLDFEVANYCEKRGKERFSSGAITIARKKVNFEAFRSILQYLSHLLPTRRLYKGYQVVAGDGCEMQLPKSPELTKKYGKSEDGCRWPKAHAVCLYDVLNTYYLDAVFEPYPTDERQAVISMLEHQGNFTFKPQIFLFDRGFPSVGLIQKLNECGKKFVFRVAKNFSSETTAFIKSGVSDASTTITYTKSRTRTNRTSKDLMLPYTFNLRFVKVALPSGENEILITNLFADEFTLDDIYTLYGKRWGIETSYNHLKNDQVVEQWGSILGNSIKQEFYTALITLNLSAIVREEAQASYDAKKNLINELINTSVPSALAKL